MGTSPRHRAAIVSRVIDPVVGVVDLQVFKITYLDGSHGIGNVELDPRFMQGTWHFIEDLE